VCYEQRVPSVARPRRLLAAVAGIVGAVAVTTVVGQPLAACAPCHGVDAEALDLECASSSTFDGELHFTDAATFRSFLTDRCLGPDAAAAVTELVDAVDFATDAVVVARGARAGTARCVEERTVDDVSVCDDGVHVAFADVVTNATPCAGDWTIAFSLPRAELRAAIADAVVVDENF
jgi:hypothetical protein